jgi:hypothetical protein
MVQPRAAAVRSLASSSASQAHLESLSPGHRVPLPLQPGDRKQRCRCRLCPYPHPQVVLARAFGELPRVC